jgi:hypothetical protein
MNRDLRKWRDAAVVVLGVAGAVAGGFFGFIFGALIAGNYAVNFEFAWGRGWEAGASLGALLGFVIGGFAAAFGTAFAYKEGVRAAEGGGKRVAMGGPILVAARILTAILLVGVALFCGFGFLASYELGFPNIFHLLYGLAGVAALLGAVWLVVWPGPSSGQAPREYGP